MAGTAKRQVMAAVAHNRESLLAALTERSLGAPGDFINITAVGDVLALELRPGHEPAAAALALLGIRLRHTDDAREALWRHYSDVLAGSNATWVW